MKKRCFIAVLCSFSFFGAFLAPTVTAKEPQPSTMTLSWWNRGWNFFRLDIHEIFENLFLLEFERGGPAEKLMLGIPLEKQRGNEYFPCKIIATGPAEVFEGQKINLFLIWEQNYGERKGQKEAVPVQLGPIFIPEGYDSFSYIFSPQLPIRICREKTSWGGNPFVPQLLFNHSVVVKKLPKN